MTHKGKSSEARMMEDQEALDLAADWADISQGLRKDLGQQLHTQWIKPIQLGSFCKETGTLDLFLPTEFSANWVADRFADRLSLAWKIARSEVRHVRISVHPARRQMPDLRLGGSSGRRPANDGAPAAPIPEPGPLTDFVVERCWETDQAVMARRLALLENYDVSDRLWRLDMPTLVVAGSRDVIVPATRQKALASFHETLTTGCSSVCVKPVKRHEYL